MIYKMPIDDFIAALTIWREASAEPYLGKVAVGEVIWQRGKERKLRPLLVCVQPWQFSCHNENDPNSRRWPSLVVDGGVIKYPQSFLDSVKAWEEAKSGSSITKGANHYHANYMTTLPKWAVNRKPVATIGRHIFYKL